MAYKRFDPSTLRDFRAGQKHRKPGQPRIHSPIAMFPYEGGVPGTNFPIEDGRPADGGDRLNPYLTTEVLKRGKYKGQTVKLPIWNEYLIDGWKPPYKWRWQTLWLHRAIALVGLENTWKWDDLGRYCVMEARKDLNSRHSFYDYPLAKAMLLHKVQRDAAMLLEYNLHSHYDWDQ